MAYSAGDLQVSITGISRGATGSIDKVIKSLSRLQTAITDTVKVLGQGNQLKAFFDSLGSLSADTTGISNSAKSLRGLAGAITKLNGTQTVMASNQLELLFEKLNKIGGTVSADAITKLSQAGRAISALSKIGNIGNLDFNKVSGGFAQLATAITPFIDKVQQAEKSLVALETVLKKSSVWNKSGKSGGGRGGLGGLLNFGKIATTVFMARRLATIVGGIAQSGADYVETLNLWETAMGNNIGLANEFVKKMNEAYGISEKTLMNAQAIFKNMLGSLGQISDQMAYNLSEGITQMAVDYASLYNTTFDTAFEKFQSALAGQVRPIRSVSGFDITENTIYQLYKQLGGQKSVRNLGRTEKQLLGLLAIFNQMNASGALGDLNKTMESYANQARVTAEAWAQIKSYAGIVLTNFLQTSGLMKNLNALLLFVGDVLKSVAETYDAVTHFGGSDPFAGVEQGANDASKAIDKVTGKLFDFDKFRSASSDENPIALDEKLLQALSGYGSILENASFEARKLADNLKIASGLFDEDGTFNVEKWENLVGAVKSFGEALLTLLASRAIIKVVSGLIAIFKSSQSVSNILLTGIVWAIFSAINAFKEGDYWSGVLAVAIGSVLAGAFVTLRLAMAKGTEGGFGFIDMLKAGKFQIGIFVAGLGVLIGGIMALSGAWDDMGGWQRAITIISALTAGVIGLVVAIKAFQLSVPVALGLGMALAGGVLTIGSMLAENSVTKFAEGGMPETGTMFLAGEAGAEIVYESSNGRNGVANIQQIKSAQLQALKEWWATARNDLPQFKEVSKTGIYEITKSEATRRGDW